MERQPVDRPDGFYVVLYWFSTHGDQWLDSVRVALWADNLKDAVECPFPDPDWACKDHGVTIAHWSPGRAPIHIITAPAARGEDCRWNAYMAFMLPDIMTSLLGANLPPAPMMMNLRPWYPECDC